MVNTNRRTCSVFKFCGSITCLRSEKDTRGSSATSDLCDRPVSMVSQLHKSCTHCIDFNMSCYRTASFPSGGRAFVDTAANLNTKRGFGICMPYYRASLQLHTLSSHPFALLCWFAHSLILPFTSVNMKSSIFAALTLLSTLTSAAPGGRHHGKKKTVLATATSTYDCGLSQYLTDSISSSTSTSCAAFHTSSLLPVPTCQQMYNDCRAAQDADMAYCASQYAACLGYNPFTSAASSPTDGCGIATSRPSHRPHHRPHPSTCRDKYNRCLNSPDANLAYCSSRYVACLGYDPVTGTKSESVPYTPYVTQVVTAYTTYCPSSTIMTYQNKTYAVTEATSLTITDCPCTITTPLPSLPSGSTITSVVTISSTIVLPASSLSVNPMAGWTIGAPVMPTSTPVVYTGSAGELQVSRMVLLVVLGAVML